MSKLLSGYVDKNVSQDELYRAAAAGMLESLNSGDTKGDEKADWNRLLSPDELAEMRSDLSGKVSGIGIEISFDKATGHGRVLTVIHDTPAEKAGMKADDEILSVEGKRFKNGEFKNLVYALRGKDGESVHLKILREDKVLSLAIARTTISWMPVSYDQIDPTTGLLTLRYFTEEAPGAVERAIAEASAKGVKKLLIDLRGNAGGGFEQAVSVADLLVPKGGVIVKTRDREGKEEEKLGKRGGLSPAIEVIVLTDHGTTCGGELLAEALREDRGARIVGQTTFGKWNMQTVELLPNHYGIKYTVMEFLSPSGKSFQGVGVQPDLEVSGTEGHAGPWVEIKKRLAGDAQLRAALELAHAG
jgi:carboxyl-terminal processing protease